MTYFKYIRKSFRLKHSITYFIIAAFLIVAIVLSENHMLNRSMTGLLSKIAYSIILAISLNLVVGFLGELSLGHAGFMCIGAYIGCFAASYLSGFISSRLLVLIISMIIGALAASVFGFIIGLPALRLKGDYLAIVTLAFGEIVRNIFKNLPWFGGALGYVSKTYRPEKLFIVSFVTVIVVLFLSQNLIRSKHGRAITAIRDNEIAAKAMGVNVTFYKLFVFVISAAFAGIAGVLYGHFASPVLYSVFSYNYSIEILVMVVLGGMGSVNGSIIAAVLITVINFFLQDKLSGDLAGIKLLVYALILVFLVLFNNAPAFSSIKNKFSIAAIKQRRAEKNNDPERINDDGAEWDRIETKIKMDEVLSVDMQTTMPEMLEDDRISEYNDTKEDN